MILNYSCPFWIFIKTQGKNNFFILELVISNQSSKTLFPEKIALLSTIVLIFMRFLRFLYKKTQKNSIQVRYMIRRGSEKRMKKKDGQFYSSNNIVFFLYYFLMGKKITEKSIQDGSCPKCSICMEKKNRASVDCGHRFCMKCIMRWIKRNKSCPLCRTSISTIKHGNKIKHLEPIQQRDIVEPVRTESLNRMRIYWKPLFFFAFPYPHYQYHGSWVAPGYR